MRKKWKRLKRWKKWMLGTAAGLIVIVAAGTAYLYSTLHSMKLDQIKARHMKSLQPLAGEQANSAKKNQEKTVPAALQGSMDKASQFTNKKISAQDAMDVAAILLNSGLSMKEVYYLTGQATEKLSTEEKQKIRDLLLKKLSKEEIGVLRSITEPYGKNLVILDPDYPIELVGVYDSEQRKAIMKQLEDRTNKSETLNSAPHESEDTESAEPDPSPASPDNSVGKDESVSQGTDSSASTGQTESQEAAYLQTKNKYAAEISRLQSSCQAQAQALIASIKAKISKDMSLEQLKNTSLAGIAAAEASCDGKFQDIMNRAGEEYKNKGFSPSDISRWKQMYSAEKANIRAKGLAQLSAALNE